MNALQRDAMARAQRGDWDLADAIELLARIDNDNDTETRTESDLVAGIRLDGRLRWLVFGADPYVECEECDGGTVVCSECGHEDDCDECDGSGEVFGDDVPDLVTDLNGTVIYRRDSDDAPPPLDSGQRLDKAWAKQVVAEYEKSVADANEQTAVAAATATRQTTLIPETT